MGKKHLKAYGSQVEGEMVREGKMRNEDILNLQGAVKIVTSTTLLTNIFNASRVP